MALKKILEPIQINGVELKNRIVRTAHGTMLGHGRVTDDLIAYYEARAHGGVGLSILEVTCVHPSSVCPTLFGWNDDIIDGYRQLAEASHNHGMKMFAQLWHGGHRWGPLGGGAGWSASEIACPRGTSAVPFAMSIEQITEIVQAFAAAAIRVKKSGLDGIEIHGGHGYLIHQFLSSSTNHREDEFGGTLDNRMRFCNAVLRAVREAVGPEYPLGIRISDYHTPDGLSAEEAGTVVGALCEEGLIDYINGSSGSPHNLAATVGTMERATGYMLPETRKIFSKATVPRLITGRYGTLDDAEQALKENEADMVSLVRAMIADPDLVTKTLNGQGESVRPCIGCNQGCIAGIRVPPHIMRCTVNPAVGNERAMSEHQIRPCDTPQKVVVIGGGPAGMEAARVAALCGHNVVLFEAQPDLGGAINLARLAPNLHKIADITIWLEQEIYRLGVEVHLSTYAEYDEVIAQDPDSVIIATGSLPRGDGVQVSFPGLSIDGVSQSHVYSTHDIFFAPAEQLGSRAVVFDDVGDFEAVAVAEYLITQGLSVVFATRHSSFAPPIEDAVRSEETLKRLRQGDFRLETRARLIQIESGQCELGYIEGDQTWQEPADCVVLRTYHQPNRDLYERFQSTTAGNSRPPIHIVGDAHAPRDLMQAIHEGHKAGRLENS